MPISEHFCVFSHIPLCIKVCIGLRYGGKDFNAPAGENGEPLALSFLRAGVRVKQREFDSLDHAYGIGEGSEAEGWISEAVDWLNQGKE